MKNRVFSSRLGPKNRLWAKPFDHTVLGSYFMKINDILTKWILKTYSMWEKCVQIMYSSINTSKIHPKCAKPTDWMGRIRTASPLHPYYSRDYRSTSHIKLRSRRTGVVPEVQVCVFECVSGPRRIFQIHEKSWFFTTSGSKKIVHAPNPLGGPYSAHILWTFMIV